MGEVADARWRNAAAGRYVVPRRGDVRPTVGYEFVDPQDGDAILRAYAANPPGRGDGAASRGWVARALVALKPHVNDDWIVVGHQQLADLIVRLRGPRLSRQTVQRVVAEMIGAGIIQCVFRGCSKVINGVRNLVSAYAVIRPTGVDDEELDAGGLAAVVELRQRLGVEVGHLSVGLSSKGKEVDGTNCLEVGGKTRNPRIGHRLRPARTQRPERYAPRTIDESVIGAAAVLAMVGWTFGTHRLRRLATTLRVFFRAGWTPNALVAATQRYPDGRRHLTPLNDDTGIIDRGKVLWSRLRAWTVPDPSAPNGWRPLPPPIAADTVRRGPAPAPIRAEQTVEPVLVPLPPATVAPPSARAAMVAAIADGRAAFAARTEALRASRRIGAAAGA